MPRNVCGIYYELPHILHNNVPTYWREGMFKKETGNDEDDMNGNNGR